MAYGIPNPTALPPRLNGLRYSFTSLEAAFDGFRQRGFTALDYSDNLDPGVAKGESAVPTGTTLGDYSAEGSFEMYLAEWEAFMAYLGHGFMHRYFTITASYAEDGAPTITDTLVDCRVKKVGKAFQEGKEPLKVKIELFVRYIKHNGFFPLDPSKIPL